MVDGFGVKQEERGGLFQVEKKSVNYSKSKTGKNGGPDGDTGRTGKISI